ncbi:hypothetical protein E2C01_003488 [Portunus trituberculatus]|uniref:Uncharacterized protein n=1 Tax=Portunus trituberculatus TaxID=210409 RepID=A0A5B7CNT9_PORTR|nr:hypothetical protein [Portunus trituberculatus]
MYYTVLGSYELIPRVMDARGSPRKDDTGGSLVLLPSPDIHECLPHLDESPLRFAASLICTLRESGVASTTLCPRTPWRRGARFVGFKYMLITVKQTLPTSPRTLRTASTTPITTTSPRRATTPLHSVLWDKHSSLTMHRALLWSSALGIPLMLHGSQNTERGHITRHTSWGILAGHAAEKRLKWSLASSGLHQAAASLVLLDEGAGYHQSLDLRGALVDLCDAGVTVVPLSRHVTHIPHATQDLDGLVTTERCCF